jgi:hypothetical protein
MAYSTSKTKLKNVGNIAFCVACHDGMACPQVADGGDGLQICKLAANIFNKQSRTAYKGVLLAWWLGVE